MIGTIMKGIVASFAGMLVMACSGCGGGGGGSGEAAPAPAQKTVLIEAYGDSTTFGAQTIDGVLSVTKNSEPAQLHNMLQSRFGPGVTVSNQGVGGTEAFQLLSGTDGKHAPWDQQMRQSKAQIVLINFGLNDFSYWKIPQPGYYVETPEEYGKIIAYLVQTARAAGKTVVLQEPNPTCKQPDPGTIHLFVESLRTVAAQQNVPLVAQFNYDQTVPGWHDMMSDCAHPNDEFYGIKAKQTYATVEPIVAAMH